MLASSLCLHHLIASLLVPLRSGKQQHKPKEFRENFEWAAANSQAVCWLLFTVVEEALNLASLWRISVGHFVFAALLKLPNAHGTVTASFWPKARYLASRSFFCSDRS